MRLRIALISVGLAALVTGAVLIALQPPLAGLMEVVRQSDVATHPGVARFRAVLPVQLGLAFLVATVVIFVALYVTVGRPLLRAEEAVEQIAGLERDASVPTGGPVLSRLQRALKRLAAALAAERTRNAEQLEALRRTNEQLVRLQAELVASDRLATVGKLSAGVAHEVGNPLAGILGYLSVVRSRARGQGELLELLDRIEAEVQRIDQIVRSLLELGRPSRGKAQPLDVRPVIDSSVKLLSAGEEFRGVKVTVDCPPSLYLRAEGGPLAQVLVNLLLNAAQAMGGAGELTVRAAAQGDRGVIAVEDSGPGFAPGVAERLFEPFFTTRPAGKGTGLGLAMSRHLLSQFGGELTAGNRAGGGAVFTIALPAP